MLFNKKVVFRSKTTDITAYYRKRRQDSYIRVCRKNVNGVSYVDIPFADITEISIKRKFPLFGKKTAAIYSVKRPVIAFNYRRFFSYFTQTRKLKKIIKFVRKANIRDDK